jgi:HAD superfamily hydrolase (TIGR01549 family)
MNHPIKIISFDLDDTLWPCQPTINRAEQALYDWLRAHVPEISERYNSLELRDKRRELYHTQPELIHDLSRLRIRSFECLADELGLDRDWIQPAFDVFYRARQQVTLYDDVAPVLDSLGRQHTLVSLTNGNASVDDTGVSHWFALALNSAAVGKQKSEPDIYISVMERFNIGPEAMLHVGDDPRHDVQGAQKAGVRALWLNRHGHEWPLNDTIPDATITSLRQIHDYLDNYPTE